MSRRAYVMTVIAFLLAMKLPAVLLGVGPLAARAGEQGMASALFDSDPAADQPFRVEWAASTGPSGRSQITGYVHNNYGRTARNVQLRISELDPAGRTVASVTGPLLDSVPGQAGARFDVQVPDHGESYQVAVASFSYDFTDHGSR